MQPKSLIITISADINIKFITYFLNSEKMEIFRILTLALGGTFFIYLSAKEGQKETMIIFSMIAAYLLFEAAKRLLKLLKKA